MRNKNAQLKIEIEGFITKSHVENHNGVEVRVIDEFVLACASIQVQQAEPPANADQVMRGVLVENGKHPYL